MSVLWVCCTAASKTTASYCGKLWYQKLVTLLAGSLPRPLSHQMMLLCRNLLCVPSSSLLLE